MSTIRHTLFLFLLFCCASESLATHIVGGGITYECLGSVGNSKRYRFTMKVYRDCLNGQAPFDDPAAIGFFRGTYQQNSYLYTVDVARGSVNPVNINEPNCINNLPSLCLQEATYTWERTLAVSTQSYFIVYQRCCRTNAISNILNPGENGATYFVEITPKAQQVCNSSPVFNQFPPVVVCNNYPLEVNYSATDKDGDQLVYSFCAPYKGGGQSGGTLCNSPMPDPPCGPPFGEIAFTLPTYTPDKPMGGDPLVKIDSKTGFISGTPNKNGQFVVGVCVEEYRNGELLSVSRRDFQFNVAPCAPLVTALVKYDELIGPQHYLIKSCGDSKTVTVVNESFLKTNIKNFRWDFDLKNGTKIQDSTHFDLTVNFPAYGAYNGSLILNKGQECGDTALVRVELHPPATLELGPDVVLCKDSTVILDAGPGFVSYLWQDSSTARTFAASTIGVYHVAATDSCGNVLRDSIFITYSLINDIKLPNVDLCPGKSTVVSLPGFDQYQWSPAAGLSCTNCPAVTIQPSVSTTYALYASNSDGCFHIDTFTVHVLPAPTRTQIISFYPGQSVVVQGKTYTQPTTLMLEVPSTTGGCDSLNTYILQLIPTSLSLECPANLTVALPSNLMAMAVNYALPGTTTNCPGGAPSIKLLEGIAPGGIFPAGLNKVCYEASNNCGNRDSCCFSVTVTQLKVQCPANLTVALPAAATATTVNYALPTATTDCPGASPTIQLLHGLASGSNFPAGLNKVCYQASNSCGNRDSCCFTVTATQLNIQCPANLTVALPATATTTVVNYALPTATTDCPGSSPTIQLLHGLASGNSFPAGVNKVCYQASNSCGNRDSCCFTVTATQLKIQCPADLTVALPATATTVTVNYTLPSATSDCPGSSPSLNLMHGIASGGNFPAGANKVCYQASNGCGNRDSCCFTVRVTSLSIQCPANMTVRLPATATSAPVVYLPASATTDCPGSSPSVQLLHGIASGGIFSAGVHTVCFEASNGCGNRDSCCFQITVSTLTVQCPANLTVTLPVAAVTMPVNYDLPVVTTICPSPQGPSLKLLKGLPVGGNFPVGVNKVCYEASNPCGNRDSCCFNITVVEPANPCDIKTLGCLRFELLDIRLDSIGQRRYRIRFTNYCAPSLVYAAIQMPNGVLAVSPKEGATYTAPSGNPYLVRNPNYSPFFSVRYKALTENLNNGKSDVFEYRLPQQSQPAYILVGARLADGSFVSSHLNTFYCPVQPWAGSKPAHDPETGERDPEKWNLEATTKSLSVYPNPTDGWLWVDLSAWQGQPVHLQVLNAQGQVVLDQHRRVENEWLDVEMDRALANGLYYLVVQPVGGERSATRFVLER